MISKPSRSLIRRLIVARLNWTWGRRGRRDTRERDHLLEPVVRHHNVVIEQHQLFAVRLTQPLIDRGRKTAINLISDVGDWDRRGILEAGQIIARAIGRAVIDNDELPR
jgi:hypothetical protein